MIQPTELRIGNYVNGPTGLCKVRGTTVNGIWLADTGGPVNMDWIEPIPLTEDWLLKMGFYRTNDIGFKNGTFELSQYMNYCLYDANGDYVDGVKIKYVHSLQNIFLSLTGTELTIK